jgi:hypothetical protein
VKSLTKLMSLIWQSEPKINQASLPVHPPGPERLAPFFLAPARMLFTRNYRSAHSFLKESFFGFSIDDPLHKELHSSLFHE